MAHQLERVSLCLLDNVALSGSVKFDESEIRLYEPGELEAMLGAAGQGDRLARFQANSNFPWARRQERITPGTMDGDFHRCLQEFELSYQHAGLASWYPFTDLLRTLNLLKPADGPVIARQFYSWVESAAKTDRHVDRVIYGEPLWEYDGPSSDTIHPRLAGYEVEPSDVPRFSELREQLASCVRVDRGPSNSHLRTAIHFFERGDRQITSDPLPGSFDAIDPLVSYEAALEALWIRECETGVEDNLSRRVSRSTNGSTTDVENFMRRAFWLRSKMAHGARPIEEIENLIVRNPNDRIEDSARSKTIPAGDYKNLLIREGPFFPGYLVNLRELTRRAIRLFCDELVAGHDKDAAIGRFERVQ